MLTERGFQAERRRETVAANQEAGDTYAYYSLIEKRMLEDTFEFATHGATLPRPRESPVPKNAYRGSAARCSIDVSSIVGTNATPKWHRHTPGSWTRCFAERFLLHHIDERNHWARERQMYWLAAFFPKGMPLLARESEAHPWLLVLGPCEDVAVLCWPVVEVFLESEMDGALFFRPQDDSSAKATWCF